MITELKRMECEVVIDRQVNNNDKPPFIMPNVSRAVEGKVMTLLYKRIRSIRILLNRVIQNDLESRLQKIRNRK